MYFTALYEKCDTTGHMKDITLCISNVLLMLRKWWIVEEKMEFCALLHDYGYCSFTTRVSVNILNQILLEVLMNCTNILI